MPGLPAGWFLTQPLGPAFATEIARVADERSNGKIRCLLRVTDAIEVGEWRHQRRRQFALRSRKPCRPGGGAETPVRERTPFPYLALKRTACHQENQILASRDQDRNGLDFMLSLASGANSHAASDGTSPKPDRATCRRRRHSLHRARARAFALNSVAESATPLSPTFIRRHRA